jgi:hypothetical protein
VAGIAGRYRFSSPGFPAFVATVTLTKGKVFIALRDTTPPTELLAKTDSTFFDREQGFSVVFNRNQTGRVISLTAGGQVTGQKIK